MKRSVVINSVVSARWRPPYGLEWRQLPVVGWGFTVDPVFLRLPDCMLRAILFEWCGDFESLINFDRAMYCFRSRKTVWGWLQRPILQEYSPSPKCAASAGLRWLSERKISVKYLRFPTEQFMVREEGRLRKSIAKAMTSVRGIDYVVTGNAEVLFRRCIAFASHLHTLSLTNIVNYALTGGLLTDIAKHCKRLRTLKIIFRDYNLGGMNCLADGVSCLISANRSLKCLILRRVPLKTGVSECLPAELRELTLKAPKDRRYRLTVSEGMAILRKCTNLTELRLIEYRPLVTNEFLACVAQSLTSLQCLELPACKRPLWTDITLLTQSCTSLTELHVPFCPALTYSQLEAILNLPSLTSLTFCGVQKAHSPPVIMDGLEYLQGQSISVLKFRNCPRLHDQLLLRMVRACPNVEALSLISCNAVTTDGLVTLLYQKPQWNSIRINDCPNLTEQDLRASMVGSGVDYTLPTFR